MGPNDLTTDGIHLNGEGYTRWNGTMITGIEKACG